MLKIKQENQFDVIYISLVVLWCEHFLIIVCCFVRGNLLVYMRKLKRIKKRFKTMPNSNLHNVLCNLLHLKENKRNKEEEEEEVTPFRDESLEIP